MPNKHPDWTFLALLEEHWKILTQFWHNSSLMNFFNEGDWFQSFSSHTCNTWKHLFSVDWTEGTMGVPIIYRFYKTASNEILNRMINSTTGKYWSVAFKWMVTLTFISFLEETFLHGALHYWMFLNFDGFFFAEFCAVLWGFFLIAQFLKLLMRPVWGRLRVLLISASGLWMRMKN